MEINVLSYYNLLNSMFRLNCSDSMSIQNHFYEEKKNTQVIY